MIEQLKSSIKALKYEPNNIDWNYKPEIDNFIKQQDSKLQSSLPVLHIPRFPQSQAFKKSLFFRITSKFPGFDGNKIEHFTFPTEFSATVSNRCNYKGYPVFYCGEHPLFSLIEYAQGEIKRNEDLYLGVWRVSDSEKTCSVLPIMAANMPKGNSLFPSYDSYKEEINAAFAAKGVDLPITEYLNLLFDGFTKPNEHHFSQLISHQFLHDSKNDCVIYPSSQGSNEFNNYAFSPECFKRFELVKVLKIGVTLFDASPTSDSVTFKSSILGKGVPDKSGLVWQDNLPLKEQNFYNSLIRNKVSDDWIIPIV